MVDGMKVCVIGAFDFRHINTGGQTVKAKTLADTLEQKYGVGSVTRLDTHGRLLSLLKAPFYSWRALAGGGNVVIMPAHNGLRVYGPLLASLHRLFPKVQLHYVVIGGWLPEFLRSRPWLSRRLKRFDGIYVETNTMRAALEKQGFHNIFVMPNSKKLPVLRPDELVYGTEEPFRLCTFSRVLREKGIGDAVEAVKTVNETAGRIVYTLDIYGQIDERQKDWFSQLRQSFPAYVRYTGVAEPDQSVAVLKDYYALLFPTHYFTEGIPGTILDAYCAGTPVISAAWESFSDIIENNVTGIGYSFDGLNGLTDKLTWASENAGQWNAMKENCLRKAMDYQPERVAEILSSRLK